MDPKFTSILKNHKVKPTAMRLLVLEKLSIQHSAISLTDLEDQFERSDRITIYRTLKLFEQKGLIHIIDDGTGAPKYARCSSLCSPETHHDMHVHFHCNKCDTTLCLYDTRFPEIGLPENYQAHQAELVIKGICAACR